MRGGGSAEMTALCTREFIRWAEVNYGYDMRLDIYMERMRSVGRRRRRNMVLIELILWWMGMEWMDEGKTNKNERHGRMAYSWH